MALYWLGFQAPPIAQQIWVGLLVTYTRGLVEIAVALATRGLLLVVDKYKLSK